MAKMGRPKKAPKERQTKQIAIRVTPAEFGQLRHAAGKVRLSDYIRQKLGLRERKP
jgi:flagellar biosynthesis/type III secretory pathway protein FliH